MLSSWGRSARRSREIQEGIGREALVVVHVGVNDVGRVRSQELVDRYRVLPRHKNIRRLQKAKVAPMNLKTLTTIYRRCP